MSPMIQNFLRDDDDDDDDDDYDDDYDDGDDDDVNVPIDIHLGSVALQHKPVHGHKLQSDVWGAIL